MIGCDLLGKKRCNYLSGIEGVVKIFNVVHKMRRYLLIYYKLSFDETRLHYSFLQNKRVLTIDEEI